MKFSQVILLTALSAGLAAGCTRKPKNITPIPSSERIGRGSTSLNGQGTPLPGDSSNLGRPSGGDPTSGRPFRPQTNPNGTDLGTGNTANPNPNPNGNPPPIGSTSDTAQPSRDKWETWPQDPDTLRGDTIYFDFDKSVVKRSETAKVAAIAEYLKGHPGYMLKLDGHADERGTEEYNRALGERRALGVREVLLNLGIPAESIVTATFGEDRPADLGHNEAAWAKNRRAEPVLLIPPGSTR